MVMLVMVRGYGLLEYLNQLNRLLGNLHLNVVAKDYSPEIQAALEPYIYEVVCECWNCFLGKFVLNRSSVASYRGSISAEHGIGYQKTHALHYSKDKVSIDLMRKIKNVIDPNGIMNPGKVLE